MTVMRHLGHCTQHNELTDGCISCGDAEAQLARATGQPTAAVALHHLRGAVDALRAAQAYLERGSRISEDADVRAKVDAALANLGGQ